MKVSKIDVLFELCSLEIEAGTIEDERIIALLVQGLLISICAEFEIILKRLTNKRGKWLRNNDVCDYNTKYAEKAFRSASPGNIEKVVEEFGCLSKVEFNRLKAKDERAWAAYGSIISNRNDVAHGRQFQATLREVREFYERGHEVLDWFESALWVENG